MTDSSLSFATVLESSIILALSAILFVRLTPGYSEDPHYSTVTMLQSSANPAGTGDRLTLTASVHRGGVGIETGTVRFYDETEHWLLGIADAASPSIMVSALKPGLHVIRAHYSGVPDHIAYSARPSVSAPLTQVVLVSPKIALSVSREISIQSPLMMVTATVIAQPDRPAGSVTFRAGEKVLARQVLDQAGKAAFITSALDEGEHVLSAEYHGDGVFAPVTASVRVRHGSHRPVDGIHAFR